MANEWVKVELYGANNDGNPRRYAISDGVAVSKGTLLALVDARTASGAISTSAMFAGVAAEEHVVGEGVTSISVWTDGIFEASASGAIPIGSKVTGAAGNKITLSGAAQISAAGFGGASELGYVLEEAADAEIVNVRLML